MSGFLDFIVQLAGYFLDSILACYYIKENKRTGYSMAYRINADVCIVCGACEPVCPAECISVRDDGKRVIDEVWAEGSGDIAVVCEGGYSSNRRVLSAE